VSDNTTTKSRAKGRRASKPRVDVYQAITDQILALLAEGTVAWHRPWDPTVGFPRSLSTGKTYRGINTFHLGLTAQAKGYSSPWWGTYNQIAARGGQVRRGEKGTQITLWTTFESKTEVDENGKPKTIPMIRLYSVFNAEQVDDAEGKTFKIPKLGQARENAPIDEAEAIFADYFANRGPAFKTGSTGAWYDPRTDLVSVPSIGAHVSAEEYYSTLAHEATHSTGHATRLNRKGITELGAGHKFGDPAYCAEELIAEMGAAMVCGTLGLDQVTLANSAAYINGWRNKLSGEPKLVVQAAAAAQKAVDLILGAQPEEEAA
jgi:antirestriction protein ArdC